MNPALMAQMLFSALTGGTITGVISWIKFSNALAILRVDVDNQEKKCQECRSLFRDEIVRQRKHEEDRGVDYRKDRIEETAVRAVQHKIDADMLEKRLTEINDRLASIEEHLRVLKPTRPVRGV